MEYPALTPDQMAKILRARRKNLELTQQEAAKLVGLMPKTVSALENKPESSTIESLFKYFSAFNFEMRLQPKESSHETEKKPEW